MRAAVASEIGAIVARNSSIGAVVGGASVAVDVAVSAGGLEDVVVGDDVEDVVASVVGVGVGAAGVEPSVAHAPLTSAPTTTAAAQRIHRRAVMVES